MGVLGAASPASVTTVMTLAVMPTTFFFLCASIIGEWSSNHCADLASASMRLVASKSLNDTTDS